MLAAPAKLTLSLRVTGRRPDGYHLLESEMVTVDLVDSLFFGPGDELSVVDEIVGGTGTARISEGPDNLVARALVLVGRRASVRVVKRIPAGAGLGGGSADAAAVLRWARWPEPALAVGLGSDVPFCVRGGRARVTGVGEAIEPLPFEDRRFVLLLPPLSVRHGGRLPGLRRERGQPQGGVRCRRQRSGGGGVTVAPRLGPGAGGWPRPPAVQPRLAGSGSTWFVEGEPGELGLEGMEFLELDGERAALQAVVTTPPETDGGG